MLRFRFTEKALKDWNKLDKSIQIVLEQKLSELKNPDLFDAHSKAVKDIPPATHRIKIGYYRFLFRKEGEQIIILSLGHRRDIYR